MIKSNSTNAINRRAIMQSCGMGYTLEIIGGRWKPAIICRLLPGAARYSELRQAIVGISERMLAAQLKELVNDGILERLAYAEVPARVEYRLTELGMSMRPMLDAMSTWGEQQRARTSEPEEIVIA